MYMGENPLKNVDNLFCPSCTSVSSLLPDSAILSTFRKTFATCQFGYFTKNGKTNSLSQFYALFLEILRAYFYFSVELFRFLSCFDATLSGFFKDLASLAQQFWAALSKFFQIINTPTQSSMT